MGKKVYVECMLEWSKLRPEDRDMGPQDGSDMARKFDETQGQYVVNCVVNEEQKAKMIKDGIPNKGMMAQLFKTDKEGKEYYKAKRPHMNPKFVNKDTGGNGVVMGPPEILMQTDSGYEPYLWDSLGLIGNGTKAIIKFDVWDNKIVTMEKIAITEHVPYVQEEPVF